MGIKDVARETMEQANVSIVPGSQGIIETEDEAIEIAQNIGYPVNIKATAGGGGKGIRVARSEEDLLKGSRITQKEAKTAIGNSVGYGDKSIEDYRHIKLQILADYHGNVNHLDERDYSIQRRLQKLGEEKTSQAITPEIRDQMGDAAVRAANAVDYVGA